MTIILTARVSKVITVVNAQPTDPVELGGPRNLIISPPASGFRALICYQPLKSCNAFSLFCSRIWLTWPTCPTCVVVKRTMDAPTLPTQLSWKAKSWLFQLPGRKNMFFFFCIKCINMSPLHFLYYTSISMQKWLIGVYHRFKDSAMSTTKAYRSAQRSSPFVTTRTSCNSYGIDCCVPHFKQSSWRIPDSTSCLGLTLALSRHQSCIQWTWTRHPQSSSRRVAPVIGSKQIMQVLSVDCITTEGFETWVCSMLSFLSKGRPSQIKTNVRAMMASATMPVNVRAAHTSIGNHLGANVEMEMAHGTCSLSTSSREMLGPYPSTSTVPKVKDIQPANSSLHGFYLI